MKNLLHATRNHTWIPLALFAALVLLLPAVGVGTYWQQQLMMIAIYALIISGLNLSWGYAGELSLGQVAFFAVGAFVTGILNDRGYNDLLLALVVSMLAAGLVGFITGLPALRLKGWPLALSSFFLVLLIPSVLVIFQEYTHGLRGILGVAGPTIFGVELGRNSYYWIVMVVAALWFVVLRNIIRSRYGTALQLMKTNDTLAESHGISTARLRFSAYALGAMPAGIAGSLFAYVVGIVVPESFTLSLLIIIVAGSVVGGSRSVWGALAGATILIVAETQSAAFQSFSLIVYGAFVVLIGTVFRGGLAQLGRRLLQRIDRAWSPTAHTQDDDAPLSAIPGQRLVAANVSKHFGGVKALDGAEIVAEPGQVTALIGPNGAGKTTLLNMISGLIPADGGTIELGDVPLHGKSAPHVAQAGVARTFQTPQIPEEMTALEVVEAGCLRVGGLRFLDSVLRLPAYWRISAQDRQAARAALRATNLEPVMNQLASSLPLGSRRLLEVARVIAGAPGVLLLDEPAAGLDDEALDALREVLIKAKAAGATIVLVEHNIPFVMSVADTVWVMAAGRHLMHGTPEDVKADEAVIATYLGRRQGEATTNPAKTED